MKQISIFFLTFILLFSKLYADDQTSFLKWKLNFKNLALENNISEKTFDIAMKDVKFLPNVIKYDRYQPEFYEDTKTYISKRTSKNKINQGIIFYKESILLKLFYLMFFLIYMFLYLRKIRVDIYHI